jgi:hypothetical protein
MRRARGIVAWNHRETGDAFVFSARKVEQDTLENGPREERGVGFELTDRTDGGPALEAGRPVRVRTQDSAAPMFR